MPHIKFKGKNLVVNHHLVAPYHALVPRRDLSVVAKNDNVSLHDNLILHGDNLLALKSLLPTHGGKINCIYIDPPYNTGNENWCYNDNVKNPLTQEWLGKVVDKEDLTRHDKWLCMMYPRLTLLYELLAEDGVIFISIDDNEVHRLRMLMDEIFGDDNFYAIVNWTARNKPMNSGVAKYKFQKSEEYVLVYGKISMKDHSPFNIKQGEKKTYPHRNEKGDEYREEEIQQRKNIGIKRSDKMVFPILNANLKKGYRWTIGEETSHKLIEQNRVFVKNEKAYQIFYKEEEENFSFHPLWANFSEDCSTSEAGKNLLDKIVSGHGFETVKPIELIQKLIFHFSNKDSIIMDSFAGSGTTAHAVLKQNKEDGGARKFILVECEEYANTTTAERVRRVIKGVKKAKDESLRSGLGGSFSYFELGEAVEIRSILEQKFLPSYEELARYIFFTATGEQWNAKGMKRRLNYIGESRHYEIYLLYTPDIKKLKETALTLDGADAFPRAKSGKFRLVFAPVRYINIDELDRRKMKFCQLPFEIYRMAKQQQPQGKGV